MFDPAAAVGGVTISRDACTAYEKQESAVWVTIGNTGYCLRYYAAGLKSAPGSNPIVAGWLHGDIMGRHEVAATKHMGGLGVDAMIDQETELSQRFGVPFIFLARPGSYGSAGRHFTMRSRIVEADLVNAEIDALKARYGIQSWALGGHSGGGTLTAEMLARRNDIRCAVISSGAAAFRDYLRAHGLETLKKRNLPAWLLPLQKGLPPDFHSLVSFAETATGLCANGTPIATIVDSLNAMPEQQARVSN